MANISCDSRWHRITRMSAEENGHGTRRNARINAFRKAFDVIGDAYFEQMSRARCVGNCRRRIYPGWRRLFRPPFTTFSRPIRDGRAFRVKCKLKWSGWVKCIPQQESLAFAGGFSETLIGPFVDKDEAIASQMAAIQPDGGGKSGVFPASVALDDDPTAGFEYFYVIYLPEGNDKISDILGDGELEKVALEAIALEEIGAEDLDEEMFDDDEMKDIDTPTDHLNK